MLIEAKIVRSDEQHQEYLAEIHRLIAQAPKAGSPESDKLELLSVLVEAYEAKQFPVEPPDPIDAILFRMEEQGLRQADLVPYFGTRSRVSEVLARKRPLTVNMIRALSVGLGISAETLVGLEQQHPKTADAKELEWSKFPIKEMVARGWLQKIQTKVGKSVEDMVKGFIADTGVDFGMVAYRRSIGGDAYSPATRYSLYAWLARVTMRSRERKAKLGVFDRSALTPSFLRELVQLSWFEHGPNLAIEFLEKHGIAVIIEPPLKGTLLDGASFQDEDGTPVVGLTLRFDRVDHFWFTLAHEVAHIWKHVFSDEAFLDNLDSDSDDRREIEANRIAREALIPRLAWKRSEAYLNPNPQAIDMLSRELKIHPAIIAGRIRKERGNYSLFADLIGQGEVRRHFNFTEVEA